MVLSVVEEDEEDEERDEEVEADEDDEDDDELIGANCVPFWSGCRVSDREETVWCESVSVIA